MMDSFYEHAWFTIGLFVCEKCGARFEPPMEVFDGETIDDAALRYSRGPKDKGWVLHNVETFSQSGVRIYNCFCPDCSGVGTGDIQTVKPIGD